MKPEIAVPPDTAFIEVELSLSDLDFLTMAAQSNSMFAVATRLAAVRAKLEIGLTRRYRNWLKQKTQKEQEEAAAAAEQTVSS